MNVEKLAIGCSWSGWPNNPTPQSETRRTWQQAVDAGVRRFDTAAMYAQGHSERQLGRLIKTNAGIALNVATKAGYAVPIGRVADLKRIVKQGLRRLRPPKSIPNAPTPHIVPPGQLPQDFTTAYLDASLKGSLARLGLDTVPGFLLHSPPAEVLADPALARFLFGLRTAGLAARVGVSVEDQAAVSAALGMGPVDLLQMPVTLWETLRGTETAHRIAERNIELSVRQILVRPDGAARPVADAVADLLADPGLSAIVIGVRQRHHLDSILREFDG